MSKTKKRSLSVLDFNNDEDLREGLETTRLKNIGNKRRVMNEHCSWEMENLEPSSSTPQCLEEELKRLNVLKSYNVLDTEKDERFERLTALTSRILDAPITLISFVDMGRQWFLSNRGLGDVRETTRDLAFCGHAILSKEDVFVVKDASKDNRFKGNVLVTSFPNIRFYAGAPLLCPEGYKIGTLCVIDSKPRPEGLSLYDKQNLREMSALVVESLVHRRREMSKMVESFHRVIACNANDLLTPLSGIQLNLTILADDASASSFLDQYHKELIKSSASCAEMMGKMCHSIGDFYRKNFLQSTLPMISSNNLDKVEENKKHMVVSKVINDLRLSIEPYQKRVPVYFHIHQNLPPVLDCDETKFVCSALNYLTNACKATEEGSIKVTLSTEDSETLKNRNFSSSKDCLKYSNHLIFEVEDTGCGILPSKFPHLFTASLGLTSVATNVSTLKGGYGFSSKILIGSKFWFSVPLHLPLKCIGETHLKEFSSENDASNSLNRSTKMECQVLGSYNTLHNDSKLSKKTSDPRISSLSLSEQTKNSFTSDKMNFNTTNAKFNITNAEERNHFTRSNITNPKRPNISAGSAKSRFSNEKALVIDDSIIIRKCFDRALSNLGLNVFLAKNGMEGLNQLKRTTFKIVFCDLLMPVMDGLDCVQQYRTWESSQRPKFHQYIVGISAHASPNDADNALSKGMDKFISKPVPFTAIKEVVKTLEEIKDIEKYQDAKIDEGNVKNQITEKSSKVNQYGKPVCLVADSLKTVGINITQVFEKRGYNVIWVQRGEDALKLLKMRNWDTVFLDDQLQDLSGPVCLSHFRQWESKNRIAEQKNVYLLSGHTDAASPGFDGVLFKPFKLNNLLEIINKAKASASILSPIHPLINA